MSNSPRSSGELIETVVKEVSAIVSKMAGIQLGQKQYQMVESRLRSRMIKLGLNSFSEYLDYLKNNTENESQALLSLLTTHHTYFFREFFHFEFLINNGLTRLIDAARARGDNKIRVWSAAASRGQEAYSIAMFLDFHLKHMAPDISFEIWGTDIDPESIDFAKNGVYKADELKQSPAMYVNGHWVRGKGHVSSFSKVKDTIKTKCHFSTLSLLKPDSFLADKEFDIVFCRNVFIYFNQDQIKYCSEKMMKHLSPQGFLILGVSESLGGLSVRAEACGPSTYQHPIARSKSTSALTIEKSSPALKPVENKIYSVLCVDDSKAIHALLNKILVKENGFEIKHHAYNGQEAIKLIKENKYDAITLDLHMPELDGLGFLSESMSLNRPPTVILSSVNRDDLSIAQKALSLGASDYMEKPSLENIAQAGNEIRSKLKTAILAKSSSSPMSTKSTTEPQIKTKKKVLIVDDSQTIRHILHKIISQDPLLEVVAQAEKPSQVEALIKQHKPDVITMDIHMPEMDGVALLKKIHPTYRIPTVMISSISKEESPQVLNALEAGAIDYIQKPQASDLGDVAQQIRDKVRNAASVVISRSAKKTPKKAVGGSSLDLGTLIVCGSSTGGTEALKDVLLSMPAQIPPILCVQHIPPVFSAAFAQRLNDLCPFEVKEAAHGDEIIPNRVLIAPGGMQMGVRALQNKLIVTVTDGAPVNRHKPSVDYLFQSVADAKLQKVVAILLTGMGADGAKMMKKLKDHGARTIAQNKETCVVFGMPGEAVKIGAAEYILPLEDIAQKIIDCTADLKKKKSA